MRSSESEGRAICYYIIGISLARVRDLGSGGGRDCAPKAKAAGAKRSAKNEATETALTGWLLLSGCGDKGVVWIYIIESRISQESGCIYGGAEREFPERSGACSPVSYYFSLAELISRSISHYRSTSNRQTTGWVGSEQHLRPFAGAFSSARRGRGRTAEFL
jgi:hypothetical protein